MTNEKNQEGPKRRRTQSERRLRENENSIPTDRAIYSSHILENTSSVKVMADQTEIEIYNYSDFVRSDFLAFRTHLPVGSSAPDFQAIMFETGHTVRLSD